MTLGQNSANTVLGMGAPESTPDLSGMTKAQLLSYAGENNIGGVSASMRKADILNVIVGDADA